MIFVEFCGEKYKPEIRNAILSQLPISKTHYPEDLLQAMGEEEPKMEKRILKSSFASG